MKKQLTVEQKLRKLIRSEITKNLNEESNRLGIDLMNAKALLLKVANSIKHPGDRRDLQKIVREIERIYTNSTEISI